MAAHATSFLVLDAGAAAPGRLLADVATTVKSSSKRRRLRREAVMSSQARASSARMAQLRIGRCRLRGSAAEHLSRDIAAKQNSASDQDCKSLKSTTKEGLDVDDEDKKEKLEEMKVSAAGGSFTVQKDTELMHGEVKRGTKVIFYLKEDQSECLEERRLKDLVKKLSEFIGFPVELHVEESAEKEVTDSEDDEDETKEADKAGDGPGRC